MLSFTGAGGLHDVRRSPDVLVDDYLNSPSENADFCVRQGDPMCLQISSPSALFVVPENTCNRLSP